ncbi:MAG: chromosomal replication initiator protein DnaA [Bacteroidales bacterium]|jgi:chromosomal replication initiator protein|nr:chromosomal replication initiator protein DnaA [Bacteroidales bacterium]
MENSHTTVWKKCLDIIRDNLQDPKSFKTWFEPIKPMNLEKQVLTIQVPSRFFFEWLEEHYIDLLKKVIKRELGTSGRLQYSIVMDTTGPLQVTQKSENRNTLQNPAINIPITDKIQNIDPWVRAGMPTKIKVPSNLNFNYTFENFIEGECNRLARSAGYAIAKDPGKTAFNPLFLHSPTGLGKTHLMHAIGIQTKENFPDKTVLYVSSDEFTRQYQVAANTGSKNDFAHFYQSIDVLLIDDVHKLATCPKTQDQLFHIFNYLHQNGKQIILSSDKALVELEGIEARLLSRFKWGLATDLEVPNVETRIEILKSKIRNNGDIDIPNDVVEYIAYSISANIRELEGVLNSILAQSILNKKTITLDLARTMVDKFVRNSAKEVTIDYIKNIVCDYFQISVDDINSKTRKRDIVQARQLAMYFSKVHTKMSLANIGIQCGNKDHATVLHAYRTVIDLLDTDKNFKTHVEEIEKKIKVL